jgi:hypothetical protein
MLSSIQMTLSEVTFRLANIFLFCKCFLLIFTVRTIELFLKIFYNNCHPYHDLFIVLDISLSIKASVFYYTGKFNS